MGDDSYKNKNVPFLPLPLSMANIAHPDELMLDYSFGDMYIKCPDGETEINLTNNRTMLDYKNQIHSILLDIDNINKSIDDVRTELASRQMEIDATNEAIGIREEKYNDIVSYKNELIERLDAKLTVLNGFDSILENAGDDLERLDTEMDAIEGTTNIYEEYLEQIEEAVKRCRELQEEKKENIGDEYHDENNLFMVQFIVEIED